MTLTGIQATERAMPDSRISRKLFLVLVVAIGVSTPTWADEPLPTMDDLVLEEINEESSTSLDY